MCIVYSVIASLASVGAVLGLLAWTADRPNVLRH